MLRTIKGRLTVNVIGIVVAAILLTTAGIVWVAGKRMIQDQSRALQRKRSMPGWKMKKCSQKGRQTA